MIKTTCPQCNAEFYVKEQLVAGRIVRFRCRKCGGSLVVDGTTTTQGSSADDNSKSPTVGRQSQLLSLLPSEEIRDDDAPSSKTNDESASPRDTQDSDDEPTRILPEKIEKSSLATSGKSSVIQTPAESEPSSARLSRISMDIDSVFQVPDTDDEDDIDLTIDLDDETAPNTTDPEFEEEIEAESIPPSSMERIDLQALLSTSRKQPPTPPGTRPKPPPPPKLSGNKPAKPTTKSVPMPSPLATAEAPPVPLPTRPDRSAPAVPLVNKKNSSPPPPLPDSVPVLAPLQNLTNQDATNKKPASTIAGIGADDTTERRPNKNNRAVWYGMLGALALALVAVGAYSLGRKASTSPSAPTLNNAASSQQASNTSIKVAHASSTTAPAHELLAAASSAPPVASQNDERADAAAPNRLTNEEPHHEEPGILANKHVSPENTGSKSSGDTKPLSNDHQQDTESSSGKPAVANATTTSASKTNKTTETTPPKTEAPSGAPPFNRRAAAAAIAALKGAAASCKRPDGPQGHARIAITFAPSGRATVATVLGPPFAGTPTGGCIAAKMRAARVPPFSGSNVTVRTSVPVF